MLRACAVSGAKRFLSPHDMLTTHVVIGGQLTSGEADEVLNFCTSHQDVAVVGLEWLRTSVSRGAAQPNDARFQVSLTSLRQDALRTQAAPDPQGDAPGEAQLPLMRQLSVPSMPGGFLEQCYFTFAALKGTPEEAAAERLVRMHGGRLFTASLPSSVAAGRARAFAICPSSLPPARASALRSSNPDFAAVPETGRFTLYWLECCVQAQEVITPQRGTPCFQPLPYSLPIPGAENIS